MVVLRLAQIDVAALVGDCLGCAKLTCRLKRTPHHPHGGFRILRRCLLPTTSLTLSNVSCECAERRILEWCPEHAKTVHQGVGES